MPATTHVESEPFTGSYLWVNHDAKSRKAQPHRQRVFTHIQTRYRQWERDNRTKALRASLNIPSTNLQAAHTAAPKNKDEAGRRRKTKKSSLPKLHSAPSPSCLKGNSDPFAAYAIEITPQVNELLTFYRDLFIPSVYRTGPEGWKLSKSANAEWRRRMDGLHDKGGALTFLARHAQIASIATHSPKLGLEALSFTAKSTSVLRTRLADHPTLDKTVYWHISLLWGIEILMRNFKGAIVHGNMLRSLFEKQSSNGQVDLAMLRAVLYNDSHLLCMTMQPSVFDYDIWVPNIYKPVQRLAERDMPSLKESQQEVLDPSIEGVFLQTLFSERRKHTEIWGRHPDLSATIGTSVEIWLAVKCHIHIGQLIKHGLKSMEEADLAAPTHAGYLYTQSCLSFAALYWVRSIKAGFMIVCGVEIHDSQRSVLNKLREALYRAVVFEDDVEYLLYRNAKLYALFTGAQAERTLLPERRTEDFGWFNKELITLSKEMGLSEWSLARDVLQGFLYTDSIQPHGSLWWGSTLNAASGD